jgi:hypothetical protein
MLEYAEHLVNGSRPIGKKLQSELAETTSMLSDTNGKSSALPSIQLTGAASHNTLRATASIAS